MNRCVLDYNALQLQEGQEGLGQLFRLLQKMSRGVEIANCTEERGDFGKGKAFSFSRAAHSCSSHITFSNVQIGESQVVVLSGPTGCGKSTQVPIETNRYVVCYTG